MHALHLPRHHLLGVTLLAALLTVTVMALLFLLPAGRLGSATRPSPTGGASAVPVVTTSPVRPPLVERPVWMTHPLAPPALGSR
jgi:hypothetical protein